MVEKLRRWAPIKAIGIELVRFDTQLLENPEISRLEYEQGELAGYEVREYLFEKWGRQCVYCAATERPLTLDHVRAKSRGGTNRISNLVPACIGCNRKKDNQPVEEFLAHDPERLGRIRRQLKAPLKDAAAINATRHAIYDALRGTGLPVGAWTGGRTKYNRQQKTGLPKSHTVDALCVGEISGVAYYPERIIVAAATGRGSYSRTRSDKYGFPRLRLRRTKQVHGYQTGDLAQAIIPSGKYGGKHVGRVVVRKSGKFRIGHVDNVHHSRCTLLQRGDGWAWTAKPEADEAEY